MSKTFLASTLLFVLSLLHAGTMTAQEKALSGTALTQTDNILWDRSLELPPLPADTGKNLGVAGAFSGIIDGTLVVAGGANFPFGTPDEGGKKVWHRDVYVWNKATGWKVYPRLLPYDVAYGISVPMDHAILCIGGCNADKCLNKVFTITLKGGKPFITGNFPDLPFGLSNAAGCKVGNAVFLAGGQQVMKDAQATKVFLRLDLDRLDQGWQTLPAWPGPSRGFAVAAVQSNGTDNCFYLFSGRNYNDATKLWQVLYDGYCYNPRTKAWETLKNTFPVMASTALPFGTNHIVFFGGKAHNPKIKDGIVRVYHTLTNTLTECPLPAGITLPVTTNTFLSDGTVWIVSGETAPGIRTPIILRGTTAHAVSHMKTWDITVIIVYFFLMAAIGWFFSRRQKNSNDYFKGGGRVPWFIAGLSIFGTSLSAITFMAIPAKAYATDWSYILYNVGIVLVVPVIVLLFIPFFRKLNVTTAYEYLEYRFNRPTRVICSAAFILYQVGRMAVVLLLPSIALNIVTGFDIFLCIALMGFLSLIYTMMGGIEAVAWTDAVQVVVLLGAAFAVVFCIAGQLPDGLGSIFDIASANHKFSLGQTNFDLQQPTVWTVLIATVFTNITTYGTDQTIVQRYFTTSTQAKAVKSVYINALLSIPATLLFFFVGTALWVFFNHFPADLSTSVTDGDAILPWYVANNLPTGIVGLVIAGLFAAAMSTLSASMNSAATAFVTDIWQNRRKTHAPTLAFARFVTLAVGIVGVGFALLMATWDIKSLWDEFATILGIVLGGLGGLFLLGLITKQANSVGALCGLGGCIIIQLFVIRSNAVNLLLYSSVGFISCFVIGYIVSLLTGGNSRKDFSKR